MGGVTENDIPKIQRKFGRVIEILCMSFSVTPPKCPAFSKYIGFKAQCSGSLLLLKVGGGGGGGEGTNLFTEI